MRRIAMNQVDAQNGRSDLKRLGLIDSLYIILVVVGVVIEAPPPVVGFVVSSEEGLDFLLRFGCDDDDEEATIWCS